MGERMKIKRTSVIVLTLLLLSSAGVSPAHAAQGVEPKTPPDVKFVHFEGDSFNAVYESIVKINGAKAAAAFFEARADAGVSAEDIYPAFEGVPLNDQVEVMQASADAAAAGGKLSAEALALTSPGMVSPMAVPASYQDGEAVAGGRAWKLTFRVSWTECSFPFLVCDPTSWVEVKYTVNPGHTSSRTDITLTRWGTELGSAIRLDARVYGAGSSVSTNDQVWSAPGTGAIYNFYSSLNGKTYVFWVKQQVGTPAGTQWSEARKTGTASCYLHGAYGPICSW